MDRLRIDLNNKHSVGLGDNLCLLSALANIRSDVDLYVTNEHRTFDRLSQYKRIFKIPDQKIKIYQSETNGKFDNVGWPLKLFTEYYRPSQVTLTGGSVRIRPNADKPCIAIAGFFDTPPAGNQNEWPWCKGRPLEFWGRVFAWIKSMGYDAISVDYPFHDLENKVELLAKHCKAIISYEGGMAHLSHMLQLPCFLIDWKLPSPSTNLGGLHCDFVHRTNSVYIVRDDNELFAWNRDQFDGKISDLLKGKTNNMLVNGSCSLKFEGPGPYGNMSIVDKDNNLMHTTSGLYGFNSEFSKLIEQQYF